jgi:hypothetical protein
MLQQTQTTKTKVWVVPETDKITTLLQDQALWLLTDKVVV